MRLYRIRTASAIAFAACLVVQDAVRRNISFADSITDRRASEDTSLRIRSSNSNYRRQLSISHLVAHAGGSIKGETYTNSREAMDYNYALGFRRFELDFEWTLDGHLVAVHDWGSTCRAFGITQKTLSYNDFIRLKRLDGLHQMTFWAVLNWLSKHSDAAVVTDTKSDNRKLVAYLATHSGTLIDQFIIQIYSINELSVSRRASPRAVWLTNYKANYTYKQLLGFAEGARVDAIVVPIGTLSKVEQEELGRKCHLYEHSIPRAAAETHFTENLGVFGYYVD
jgi:glycerophosphoryl diester phosphodiesterase